MANKPDAPADDPISVIIPARNEAATIARVIARVSALACVDEVVVVDNGSKDGTFEAAQTAGAHVVQETVPGMGHAVRAGMLAARHDWVMKVDADLDRFDVGRFADMIAARGDKVGLIKGNWNDPGDNMPMTRLLVRPAVAQLAPGLSHLQAPNTGIYLADRRCFAVAELVGSYAVDIDVMLRVYAYGAKVVEVPIGTLAHDRRDVGHYNHMADEIMAFFLDRAAAKATHEIVVLTGAAEVPQACQTLLHARARMGGRVTVDGGLNPADFAGWPSARVGAGVTDSYAPAASATHLSVWVPKNAGDALLSKARAIVAASRVPVELLEMRDGVQDGGIDVAIDLCTDQAVACGFFRRIDR